MMEYMACGKPVVAAVSTGHADVLTDENSIPVKTNRPFPVMRNGQQVAQWFEPSLEEMIEKLEWAYQNRDGLKAIGNKAAEDLSKMTWAETARQFHKVLTRS